MATHPNIHLPIMGCGTWAWGNRLLWDYDPKIDDQLQQVFNLCVENGITLFDTGDSYGTGRLNGRSEQLLGQFNQQYHGANKNNICLATKLAPYPWRLTENSLINAAKNSAQRLQKNIDLVQMHWSTANYAPWQEIPLLNGLCNLYEQGLVKAIGLSNYGPKRLKKISKIFSERQIPIATLQVQYSLLSTYPVTELNLKETCDELGIKMIAYSPLALGLLTGKYQKNTTIPKGIRSLIFPKMIDQINPLSSCLQEIANYRQKTPAQVALNWCICKGTIPIPGAKNIQQAQENIGALGWQLDNNEIEELDKIAKAVPNKMVQNIFQTK